MHRIFVIAELLREIALYLGPNEWVALSSASRSWNLVVLPILWRRVDFGVFCAFGSFDYDSDSGCYTVSLFMFFIFIFVCSFCRARVAAPSLLILI